MFNIEEIQKVLPQRYPFLMIDRVVELEPGKKVVALKNVSFNEGFFSGHFPGKPIMPGVLIIEAMAQAAIMLFYQAKDTAADKQPSYYLASVKARFLNPVSPGDQLRVVVEPVKVISTAAIVKAVAEVGGKEVASAELSFSVK
jgi:3-hydroxyacyl-[acyl-carrier-protein] dehydratase